jgi:hypothetical protein
MVTSGRPPCWWTDWANARQGISSFVFMVGAKQAASTMELFAAEIMPRL